MKRTHRSSRFGLAALLAALLGVVAPTAVLAQPKVLISPPARNARDPKVPALDQYIATMQPTFAKLDELMATPAKDPLQAAEQFKAGCATSTVALDQLLAAVTPKGKPEHSVLAPYAREQAAAWAYVCTLGASNAKLLSMMNDTIDIWEQNWIPKLRAKKKTLRKTAGDLNTGYNHVKSAAAIRRNDKEFDNDLARFKPLVGAADALGRTVGDLRDFLIKEVKNGNPDKSFKEPVAELLARLSVPTKPLPNEGIWLLHLHQWRDLLFTRNKALAAAYTKVLEDSLSIREETLFRTESSPIRGLAFKKIHPTFQSLYDDLLANRSTIRAKAEAEERQWDKDRRRIIELSNETGPTAQRALKIKAAQATSAAREREANVARSKATDAEEGEREYKRRMAEIEKDKRKIAEEEAAFKKQEQRNNAETDRIAKENAKRRRALGLPSKPLPGGS